MKFSVFRHRRGYQPLLKQIAWLARAATLLLSILFLAALFFDYGYTLKGEERHYVKVIYTLTRYYFMLLFALHLAVNFRQIDSRSWPLTLLLGLLLYPTLLPDVFTPSNQHGFLHTLFALLESSLYRSLVVGMLAVMELSRGLVRFINKKTNPAMLLAATFLLIIFIGTLLLLVPRSTLDTIHLSVVDALFVATSAVCVTGLSTVEIASTFSVEGQIVILGLIQIGGLGVMTITSFFALFFMGNTRLYNQFALRDMIGSNTFTSLLGTLLYIVGFTLVIELVGAFVIWETIHQQLGLTLHEELFFALFHAVSAFCNAGFSTLSGNLGNPILLTGHNGFYWTIALLVILGGIGFPILVTIKRWLAYTLKRALSRWVLRRTDPPRYTHLTPINTRIVLVMTLILLLVGTAGMAVIEWNHAFAQLSPVGKLTHAFFNAVVPRTAGFNSIELTRFSNLSILLYMVLMWIGGASQSTAGGIKVNTLSVAIANLWSIIRGRQHTVLYGRELTPISIRRAFGVIFGSLGVILVAFAALVAVEPHLSPRELLFETLSAFSTVGSGLGATPILSEVGKVIVIVLMFIGRVGFITVASSLIINRPEPHFRCPKEDVIIN